MLIFAGNKMVNRTSANHLSAIIGTPTSADPEVSVLGHYVNVAVNLSSMSLSYALGYPHYVTDLLLFQLYVSIENTKVKLSHE